MIVSHDVYSFQYRQCCIQLPSYFAEKSVRAVKLGYNAVPLVGLWPRVVLDGHADQSATHGAGNLIISCFVVM